MKKISTGFLLTGLLAIGVLPVGIGIGYFAVTRPAHRRKAVPAHAASVRLPEPRVVYPLSIVAGGVRSIEELKRAMFEDVVARNFSGFDLSQARFERLSRAECSYVSFRGRKGVAWTSHCTWLRPGELVLTDGRLRFRAKCGNRISDSREAPTEAVDVAQLEIPLPDVVPALPSALAPAIAPIPPLAPVNTVPLTPTGPPGCCGPPILVIPIIPVGGRPITSVAAGDDWKTESLAGLLLLLLLIYRRRSTA
jgi:hypothetical protein